MGGTSNAAAAAAARERASFTHASPPKAHAAEKRPNPPNTALRRHYERSDLPVAIMQGSKSKLRWAVEDVSKLDYHHYLPIFFSGLREIEEPYRFIADQGIADLLAHGGAAKVLPVVPQLVMPIKEAMATRDERIVIRVLKAISLLADLGGEVGPALVPYYRQILPMVNLFLKRTVNIGDAMDYGQRKGNIAELIQDTLQKLERNGGPDSYINIK
jgi:hypothetical protein